MFHAQPEEAVLQPAPIEEFSGVPPPPGDNLAECSLPPLPVPPPGHYILASGNLCNSLQ